MIQTNFKYRGRRMETCRESTATYLTKALEKLYLLAEESSEETYF